MLRFRSFFPFLALFATALFKTQVDAGPSLLDGLHSTAPVNDLNVFIVVFEDQAPAPADYKYRASLVSDAHHNAFEAFLAEKIDPGAHTVRFRFTDPRFILATSVHLADPADEQKLRAFPHVKHVYRARQYALTAAVPSKIQRGDATMELKSKRASLPVVNTFEPHRMVGFDKVYAQGFWGQGQTVALIDTGVDYKHHVLNGGRPDRTACFGPGCPIKGGYAMYPDLNTVTNVTYSPDPYDTDGHGTATASAIIGNSPDRNFTGSAPAASLLAYKVFGEHTGPWDDHMLAAMLRAFYDGADIISMSISRSGGWPEDGPHSLLIPKLAQAGVITVAGPGNGGLRGIFDGQAPGSARTVTSVGSVQTNVLPGYTAKVVTSDGAHDLSYISARQFKFNQTMKLPVYATSKTPNQPADACKPLPDSTPDLSGHVVLIAGSSDIVECDFWEKSSNAAAKGARTILIYNSAPTSLEVADGARLPGVQVAAIFGPDGLSILDRLNKGQSVTLDFSASVAVNVVDKDFGGQINEFSGWALTWELQGGVSLLAIGGGLLMAALGGGYELEDGVSEAIPMVAGTQTLTISNVGKVKQRFSLVHRPAGTVYIYSDSSKGQLVTGVNRPVEGEQATVSFSPATFDLEPGRNQVVSVTFTPPPTNQPKVPIYSGFIDAKSDHDFGSVHASYLGVSANMNALPVLDRAGLPAIVDSKTLKPIVEENKVYQFLPDGTGGPSLGYRFLTGTAHWAVDLVPESFTADTLAALKNAPPSDQARFDPPAYAPGHVARVDWWLWQASSAGHSTVQASWTDYQNVTRPIEDGRYRFLLRALKLFGDPAAEDSYDSYISPAFSIKRAGKA
ncbi:hypothetical protein CF335_g7917 [Tilletia laevis]|nr:hypothetical protein CF335_g7917 [Tilletia laevis]